jgi:hypothetical protein
VHWQPHANSCCFLSFHNICLRFNMCSVSSVIYRPPSVVCQLSIFSIVMGTHSVLESSDRGSFSMPPNCVVTPVESPLAGGPKSVVWFETTVTGEIIQQCPVRARGPQLLISIYAIGQLSIHYTRPGSGGHKRAQRRHVT